MDPPLPLELYRRIVETSIEGISIINPSGSIIFVNERLAFILGYERSELLKKPIIDLIDGEDKTLALESLFQNNPNGEYRDFQFIRKNHTILRGLVSTHLLLDDSQQPVGTILSVIELDRAETLNHSRLFLDSLIENLPLMVFVKDAKELTKIALSKFL